MVAAAALGDIVKQRRHVQHPRPLEIGDQLAAERIFVRVLGHREAAQIAQHHQDVLVDRVDVIQVVLHLPDDAPEIQQVASEHAGLVHQPQRVRDAGRLLQDIHEEPAVFRVAPPVLVHHVAGVVDRAQRARRQALHAGCLFVQQEGFEDRVRLALEHVVAGDFEHALLFDEALRQHARNAARAGEELRLDVLDQDRGELRDGLGGPVVAAHQLFAGALGRRSACSRSSRPPASAGRTPGCPGDARRSRAAARAASSGSLRCGAVRALRAR